MKTFRQDSNHGVTTAAPRLGSEAAASLDLQGGRRTWARRLAAGLLLLAAIAGAAAGKSLYVITEITSFDQPTPIHAYDIDPDGKLTFQAEFGAPFYGAGTIGLAVDSFSDQLFVTFENSNIILLLNATTLKDSDTVAAPNAQDLAGIVYDHGRGLLYCVDRGTTNLYVYQWDPIKVKLNHVPGSPFTLKDAQAYGIALDELNDLLYVANASKEITVYSTWDWRLLGTIPITRSAISVAADPIRGYLYYGGGFAYNFHLAQHDLGTGREIEVEIAEDAGVMGLGVDSATGFIYTTTGQNNRAGGDDLLVFDTGLNLIQTLEDIGNPTGLVVPDRQTSYNPLHLKKIVKSPLGGQPREAELPEIAIGDTFTYSISFEPQGYDLREITMVDRLPHEVTFITATGDGTFGRYEPNTHTYRWLNPPLDPGPKTTLELTCLLHPQTPPGTIILNLVTMDTDKTPPTTTGCEAIATEVTYQPLNIRKMVIGSDGAPTGATEGFFVSSGDEVTYRICFDNRDNAHTVANVFITDKLPAEVTFVRATGDGVFGQYDRASHTYLWAYPWLAPGESACVDLVVRVAEGLEPGTVITNRATIESDRTPKTDDTVDVKVGYRPLEMRKTIVGAGDPDSRGRPHVDAGENVTYSLCFRNPSAENTVSQISIVDKLPREVHFVTAEGDGDFGFYDAKEHTYTWFYNPLGPGEQACLELVGRVDAKTEPNTVITNSATVRSKQTGPTEARVDAVVSLSPVQAQLWLKPNHIFRNNTSVSLMVTVHLPQGKGKELIADVPCVWTPGNIRATSQTIYGTSGQGKVLCLFPTGEILKGITGYGEFPIKVTGKLAGGRSFIAEGKIWVLKFGGP